MGRTPGGDPLFVDLTGQSGLPQTPEQWNLSPCCDGVSNVRYVVRDWKSSHATLDGVSAGIWDTGFNRLSRTD